MVNANTIQVIKDSEWVKGEIVTLYNGQNNNNGFNIQNPSALTHLRAHVRFDDGNIRYLKGDTTFIPSVGDRIECKATLIQDTSTSYPPSYVCDDDCFITRCLDSTKSIIDFLASPLFPKIGKKTAESFVLAYGLDTMKVLYDDLVNEDLMTIARDFSLTKPQIQSLRDNLPEQMGISEFLKTFPHMRYVSAVSILRQYMKGLRDTEIEFTGKPTKPVIAAVIELLNSNPFFYMHSVYNLPLGEVDKITHFDMGVDIDDDSRMQMFLLDAMADYSTDTHSVCIEKSDNKILSDFFNHYFSKKCFETMRYSGVPLPDWIRADPNYNEEQWYPTYDIYTYAFDDMFKNKLKRWSDYLFDSKVCLHKELDDKGNVTREFLYTRELFAAESKILHTIFSAGTRDTNYTVGNKIGDPLGGGYVYHIGMVTVATVRTRLARAVNTFAQQTGFVPDPTHLEFLSGVIDHRVTFLTGGPGTGKTSTINLLVNVWSTLIGDSSVMSRKPEILLLAPTGRAANRLKEITHHDNAGTVARFLTMNRDNGQGTGRLLYDIRHNKISDARSTLVVVDEASMLSYTPVSQLLSLFTNATIVFVGDPDQLPPISSGPFLIECLKSPYVRRYELKKVHRVVEGSQTLLNAAYKISNGEQLDLRMGGADTDADFMCIPFPNELSSARFEDVPMTQAEQWIYDLYQSYRQQGVDESDIMILSPYNKGTYSLGSHNLNIVLQRALNPFTESLDISSSHAITEFTDEGFVYKWYHRGINTLLKDADGMQIRICDRIMNRKNDVHAQWYTDDGEFNKKSASEDFRFGVFNGDMGVVDHITVDAGHNVIVTIKLDNRFVGEFNGEYYDLDRYIDVPSSGTDRLKDWVLAYCVTVHKAQGCEAKHVIIALPPIGSQPRGRAPFLTRNMLYTAITRAKESVCLIGDTNAVIPSCINTPYSYEGVLLAHRINSTFEISEMQKKYSSKE